MSGKVSVYNIRRHIEQVYSEIQRRIASVLSPPSSNFFFSSLYIHTLTFRWCRRVETNLFFVDLWMLKRSLSWRRKPNLSFIDLPTCHHIRDFKQLLNPRGQEKCVGKKVHSPSQQSPNYQPCWSRAPVCHQPSSHSPPLQLPVHPSGQHALRWGRGGGWARHRPTACAPSWLPSALLQCWRGLPSQVSPDHRVKACPVSI